MPSGNIVRCRIHQLFFYNEIDSSVKITSVFVNNENGSNLTRNRSVKTLECARHRR